MQLMGVTVEFQALDNLKLEPIFRLMLKKFSGVIAGGLDSDVEKAMDAFLNDADFGRIESVLLEATVVTGIGKMSDPDKRRELMEKHSFIFYYQLIIEAVKHYLGGHLHTALEKGYIPERLRAVYEEFMKKQAEVWSGVQSETDTQTTSPQ